MIRIRSSDEVSVCSMHWMKGRHDRPSRDEAIANARLIAAAPDMLDALKVFAARAAQPGADAVPDDGTVTFFMKDVRNAVATVAKAEGR